MADAYETLNEVLVKLFNEILTIEEKVVISGDFVDISNNDMHIISAIGIEEPKNMSTIAKELSVTTGTLTIAINNLVKKGYVIRKRGEKDRRVVYISLSEKGVAAYHHHEKFHKDMVEAVIKDFNNSDVDILIHAMTNLLAFFNGKK